MKKILLVALSLLFLATTPSVSSATQKSNIFVFLPAIIHSLPPVFGDPPRGNGQYTVIALNDLGMHCDDPSFEDFSVLPPYNNLVAQVIRRGSEPRIVTQGVRV